MEWFVIWIPSFVGNGITKDNFLCLKPCLCLQNKKRSIKIEQKETTMSLAKQLQNTASNHSGDLGGLLWDAGAKILQLEDENEVLRAQLSEKNIGQGVPALLEQIANEPPINGNAMAQARILMTAAKLRASAPPAPQQKPLTVTEDQAWNLARYVYAHSNPHESPQILLSAQEIKRIIEAAHNIGEKK